MAIKFLNTVAVDTNVLYVDASSNNVGIGTTSPVGELHVKGANPEFILEDTTNPNKNKIQNTDGNMKYHADYEGTQGNSKHTFFIDGSEKLRIATDGNVGIGTTSPGALLHLQASITNALKLNNSSNSSVNIVSDNTYLGLYPASYIILGKTTLAYADLMFLEGKKIRWNETDGSWYDVLYSSGTDNLIKFGSVTSVSTGGDTAFYHNSSEKMRLTPTGLGIGTTSPSQKLEISEGYISSSGSGTSHGFELKRSGLDTYKLRHLDGGLTVFNDTDGRKEMTFDGTGNVGIGTSSPSAPLHIEGGATSEVLKIEADANPYARWVQNGTNVGFLQFSSTNAYLSNMSNGSFLFRTQNTDRMTITGGGNVGIGTTNPARKLEVYDGSSSIISQFRSGSGTSSFICFANTGSTADQVRIGSISSNLVLSTNYTERMRIDSSGNVGIGTTSPISIGGHSGILTLYGSNATALALKDAVSEGHLRFDDSNFKFTNSDGNVRMQIEADTGNVGIGTTSPGAKLQVGDGTADTATRVYFSDNTYAEVRGYGMQFSRDASYLRPTTDNTKSLYIGTSTLQWNTLSMDASRTIFNINGGEKMRIDSTGNVGIGTTSPAKKLSIEGGGFTMFATGGTSADAFSVVTHNYVFSDENEDAVYSYANSEHEFSTQGFPRVNIDSVGLVGIGTTSPSSLLHVSGGELDVSGGNGYKIEDKPWANWASDLLTLGDWDGEGYSTRIMGSNSSEVMRVTGTNVGIGTTSPDYKLEVDGTLGVSRTDGIIFAGSIAAGQGNKITSDTSNNLIFSTSLPSVPYTTTEKVRILNNGNVGIGTTSPSEKLEVDGHIKAVDGYKGYLPAFQHGGFFHSQSSSSSAIYWIPTNYISETTSSQYYNNWIAPYDGRVSKIVMRYASGTTPTATSVTFRYAVNATTSTTTFPATVTNGASTNMTATKAFGDTDITFNAGDRVQVGFSTNGGTRLLYGFSYTIVFEYNIT